MTRRLVPALAGAAVLLTTMLYIVVGHVSSVVQDWSVANYGATDSSWTVTAMPDPNREAPNPERSARINAGLRAVVERSGATVVLDALGGDGPRVGLHDPRGRLAAARIDRGRGFRASDFSAAGTRAIVSEDSYLVDRLTTYVPAEVEVVGYFDPASLPVRSEYVYTLFQQQNVHGTYYLHGATPTMVDRFVEVLRRHSYLAEPTRLDSNAWAIIWGAPLAYAYGAGLLLGYAGVLLLVADWMAANRRRYRIERWFGARPVSFLRRGLRVAGPVVLGGSVLGAALGVIALSGLRSVSRLPDPLALTAVVAGNSVALTVLFAGVVLVLARGWRAS